MGCDQLYLLFSVNFLIQLWLTDKSLKLLTAEAAIFLRRVTWGVISCSIQPGLACLTWHDDLTLCCPTLFLRRTYQVCVRARTSRVYLATFIVQGCRFWTEGCSFRLPPHHEMPLNPTHWAFNGTSSVTLSPVIRLIIYNFLSVG